MKRLLQLVTPIAFSTLALGCNLGGSDSGGSSPIPEDQFAAELARIYCGLVHSQCSCDNPSDPDEMTCVDNETSSTQADMDAAVAAGLNYDPDCAGRFAAQYNSWGCSPLSEISSTDDCNSWCSVYFGSGSLGDPCTTVGGGFSDCGQGLYCDGSSCQDPCDIFGGSDTLGEGEACDPEGGGDAYCDYAADLWCDYETMVCAKLPSIGEACPAFQCAQGAVCDSDTSMCVAAPGIGEACPNFVCTTGATCDSNTMVCIEDPAFVCL